MLIFLFMEHSVLISFDLPSWSLYIFLARKLFALSDKGKLHCGLFRFSNFI